MCPAVPLHGGHRHGEDLGEGHLCAGDFGDNWLLLALRKEHFLGLAWSRPGLVELQSPTRRTAIAEEMSGARKHRAGAISISREQNGISSKEGQEPHAGPGRRGKGLEGSAILCPSTCPWCLPASPQASSCASGVGHRR